MSSDHPHKRAFWEAFKKLCNRLGLDSGRRERIAQCEAWFDDFGELAVPIFVDAFEHMRSSKSFVPNYLEFSQQVEAAKSRATVTTDAELCELCDRTSWPVRSTGVIHLGMVGNRYIASRDALIHHGRPLRTSERLAVACDRCTAGVGMSRVLPKLSDVILDLDAIGDAIAYHKAPQPPTAEALEQVGVIVAELKAKRYKAGLLLSL